eukprot:6456036-Amphidinium_carterae.5
MLCAAIAQQHLLLNPVVIRLMRKRSMLQIVPKAQHDIDMTPSNIHGRAFFVLLDTVEQAVLHSTASSSSTKKADSIAMSPGGSCHALDVMVTQGSMAALAHTDLATAEADK